MPSNSFDMTDADLVRFRARVEMQDACWTWQGSVDVDGYGRFSLRGKAFQAHRLAYEAAHGAIPEGLVIDHLCRNRACVRPEHLEPVTNAENILRGTSFSAANARKKQCDSGHPFDEANTSIAADGHRVCRTCKREIDRRYHERRRQARPAKPQNNVVEVRHGWWRYRQGCRCEQCRAANTEHSRTVRANRKAREQS